MAGHSKWATIKRKKAAIDQKKGAKFTTLSKNITQAAKQNPHPNSHPLREAIAHAKRANMPKANIEAAIRKAQQAASNTNLQTITYEAQAPHRIALIIKTKTNNKNRTVATIRTHLNKQNATLKKRGTNQHHFQQGSTITIPTHNPNNEQLLLTLAEAGSTSIEHHEEHLQIHCQTENQHTIERILKEQKVPILTSKQSPYPHSPIPLPPHQKVEIQNLIKALSKIDEVTQIHHNMRESTLVEKIL